MLRSNGWALKKCSLDYKTVGYALQGTSLKGNRLINIILLVTNNFLMVQAPRFIRGINPKSKIENPQAPAFIRGVNLKSKI
jgi:hypothetical protein